MLAIDKFSYKDVVANNGIVSRQYYYSDRPETFASTYQYSKEMMDWMPKELGVPYPWEVYANVPVQDFYVWGYGKTHRQTIYTDYYLQDARQALDRNYVATNAHELTHQWFGDLVTEWSATHPLATRKLCYILCQTFFRAPFMAKRNMNGIGATNTTKQEMPMIAIIFR
jgi:aminopeptidase N